MAEPEQPLSHAGQPREFFRADAVASRERILRAAATLAGDRRASMTEIAAAAGVGRSTLYRHFPTRESLAAALTGVEAPDPLEDGAAPEPTGRVAVLPHRAPGGLGSSTALRLEVTHVLDEVPPHLI